MIKDMSFGGLLREIRIRNEITLRQYCLKRGFDTGNISKLERNLLPPPYDKKQLMKYLSGLKYSELDYEFLIAAAINYQIGRTAKRFL